jgi:hypothetical protein
VLRALPLPFRTLFPSFGNILFLFLSNIATDALKKFARGINKKEIDVNVNKRYTLPEKNSYRRLIYSYRRVIYSYRRAVYNYGIV